MLLAAGRPNGLKVQRAMELNVPIVRETWLLSMGRSGHLESQEGHAVPLSTMVTLSNTASRNGRMSTGSRASVVSQNEPDFIGVKTSTPRADGVAAGGRSGIASSPVSAVSQARQLGLAPTHLNGSNPDLSFAAGGSGSISMNDSKSDVLPLSAPRPERERVLNEASLSDIGADGSEKIGRTNSAPAGPGSMPKERESGEKRSLSTGHDDKRGMTEALRHLAAKGEVTPRDRRVVSSTLSPAELC